LINHNKESPVPIKTSVVRKKLETEHTFIEIDFSFNKFTKIRDKPEWTKY
jgi:hypothetical protein